MLARGSVSPRARLWMVLREDWPARGPQGERLPSSEERVDAGPVDGRRSAAARNASARLPAERRAPVRMRRNILGEGGEGKENEELDGLEGSRSESGRGSTAGVVQEE